MIVAIPHENGNVFQHFGKSPQFKLYEVEHSKVLSEEVLETGENRHGALAGFLKEHGVDTLICGGIGGGAKMAMEEAGIHLFGGVVGNADVQMNAFLENKLVYDPDVACTSHKGHDHGKDGCWHHA